MTLWIYIKSDIPSELILNCWSVLAAQTEFCGQDAKKQRNIKQSREQTLKNTCWLNTEAPYARLYPHCWLTAGWPACMPALSQTWTHTYPYKYPGRHTHTKHTLHWGQVSKSNPGLLFCPKRTAATSTHAAATKEGKELQKGWIKNEGRWRGS